MATILDALGIQVASRSLLLLGAVGLAVGCSDAATEDPGGRPPIATLDSTTATFPQALITGVLELRKGCLVIVTPEGPVLTLWPHGSVLVGGDGIELVIGDTEIAIDGRERTYGGGFMRENGTGSDLDPPLDECADSSGADDLWLFSGALG